MMAFALFDCGAQKIIADKQCELKDGTTYRLILTEKENLRSGFTDRLLPEYSITLGCEYSNNVPDMWSLSVNYRGKACMPGIKKGDVILFKTKSGETVELESGLDEVSEVKSRGGGMIGKTYVSPTSDYELGVMYEITPEQIAKLSEGITKVRVQFADGTYFDWEYSKDKIGKAIAKHVAAIEKKRNAQKKDAHDGF